MTIRDSNGFTKYVIGAAGLGLTIIAAVIAVVLHVQGQVTDNVRTDVEQTCAIDYNHNVITDHEERMRALEDAMREISEQKSILERILNAVEVRP